MSIDRQKYMSIEEVKTLRTVTEARAIVDLRAGLAWRSARVSDVPAKYRKGMASIYGLGGSTAP